MRADCSVSFRYAIDHTSAEWAQAEAHVAKLADPNRKKAVSTVVSLKSSGSAGAKKRAGDESTDQQQAPKKKNRRSTNKGSKK
jgi:hypothetical protein